MTDHHALAPDGGVIYSEQALADRQIDFLEARADEWMADTEVQRMFNAIASVFEKWAPQDIMDRFRAQLGTIGRQCHVEGALRAWEEISTQQQRLGSPLPADPAALATQQPSAAAEDALMAGRAVMWGEGDGTYDEAVAAIEGLVAVLDANPAQQPSAAGREEVAPYPVEERAFHVVVRDRDTLSETFVASDRATLSGYPAKDRADAYAMAASLNAVVRFHVRRAAALARPQRDAEVEALREALDALYRAAWFILGANQPAVAAARAALSPSKGGEDHDQ